MVLDDSYYQNAWIVNVDSTNTQFQGLVVYELCDTLTNFCFVEFIQNS
jgi:hypothetical protein